MRLDVVAHGHTFGQKLMFRVMRLVTGFPAPGVVKTLMYRKEFWGAPHNRLTQLAMRGPSEWSVGDRELFAAYISRLNQCVF